MSADPARELSSFQQLRLGRFSAQRCVDVHCHVLPAVDDGPATLEDTLSLCRALVRDGITDVVVTPHQLGRFDGRNLPADIRARVGELQAILDARRIPLRLAVGGEVRVD
jgi:protein-tyrosine phosphatase